MNRKISFAAGIVAVLVLVGSSTDANALCALAKGFGQCYMPTGGCTNLVFPGGTNADVQGGILQGRWWQSGARNTHNEGTGSAEPCNPASWMETAAGDGTGDALRFYGFMAGEVYAGQICGGTGCPANALVVTIETLNGDGSKAYYAAGKAAGTDEWNFATVGAVDWALIEIPRPEVTNSSRAGNTVSLNVHLPPPTGARGETGFLAETIVTGYQLVTAQGQTDPGRNPAAWTPVGNILPTTPVAGSDGPIQVQCAGTAPTDPDTWVATRLVYDNGQLSSVYVGEPRRIECSPAVADPRFNMIKKPTSGRGDIRTNPR